MGLGLYFLDSVSRAVREYCNSYKISEIGLDTYIYCMKIIIKAQFEIA
jgi:hypothetical protein